MYVEITGIENPIISKFELERDFTLELNILIQ